MLDPWVERWRFAGAVAQDPVAISAMSLGPNIARLGETARALYCMDQLSERVVAGRIMASYLVEVPGADDADNGHNSHIVGFATADPDVSLVRHQRIRSGWESVPVSHPVTRVEACVVGDDKFNKMNLLLTDLTAAAIESFGSRYPDSDVRFMALLPESRTEKGFPEVMAGFGSVIPFHLAAGNYAWADKKRRFGGRAAVLGSDHNLLDPLTNRGI